MSEKTFSKVMRGLKEAKAYVAGAREGYKVSVPPNQDYGQRRQNAGISPLRTLRALRSR